jgi:hypothetical protein
VSAKGAGSVYGLGRYPVTLYYEQWIKLLGHAEPLRSFLEANKGALKLRSTQPAAAATPISAEAGATSDAVAS